MQWHTVSGLQMSASSAQPSQLDMLLKHICRNTLNIILNERDLLPPVFLWWCSFGNVGERAKVQGRPSPDSAVGYKRLAQPDAKRCQQPHWHQLISEVQQEVNHHSCSPRKRLQRLTWFHSLKTRCVKQHELHSEKFMFHCNIKPAVPEATAEAYAVKTWNVSYATHYLDISSHT